MSEKLAESMDKHYTCEHAVEFSYGLLLSEDRNTTIHCCQACYDAVAWFNLLTFEEVLEKAKPRPSPTFLNGARYALNVFGGTQYTPVDDREKENKDFKDGFAMICEDILEILNEKEEEGVS